jgi:hypothetical protein
METHPFTIGTKSTASMPHNNAINADGLGQRASGASPKPAGYGERYTSRDFWWS